MTAPLDLDVIRARLAADAADAADQTYDKHDPYGTSAPYARDVAALLAEVERLRTFIDKAVMPRYCEMFEELGLGDPTTSVVVEEAARLLRLPTALPGEGGAS